MKRMPKLDQKLEKRARTEYYRNWGELPNGRFPPHWENTTEEIRNWVRAKVARGELLYPESVEPL